MSRYRSSGSYSHVCQHMGGDDYRLSWTADRYYRGSRLRFPRRCSRWTDAKGAVRFCRRWNIELPESLRGEVKP